MTQHRLSETLGGDKLQIYVNRGYNVYDQLLLLLRKFFSIITVGHQLDEH